MSDPFGAGSTYTVRFEIDTKSAFQCKKEHIASYDCFILVGEVAEELSELLNGQKSGQSLAKCEVQNGSVRCTLKYEYQSPSRGGSSSWD